MGGLTGAATPYVTNALGFGGTGYADHSGSAVAGLLGGSSGGSDGAASVASGSGASGSGGLGGLLSGGMNPKNLALSVRYYHYSLITMVILHNGLRLGKTHKRRQTLTSICPRWLLIASKHQ